MIALKTDLWDAIFTLKILEKRLLKSISRVKAEEKRTYREIVDAILNNDKGLARDYARQYLRLREKRRVLEKYLSKVKLTRIDLETAAATKDIHDALLATAKAISRIKNTINEVDFVKELEKARNVMEDLGIILEEHLEETPSIREEEKISELLRKVETVAEEVLRKEIPEIPDEIIREEVEELEEEKE